MNDYRSTDAKRSLTIDDLPPGILNDRTGDGRPALILIHEWWGLTEQMRGVADRFAREGYATFAADLYRGQLPRNAEEAQQFVASGDKARWLADLRRAVAAFASRRVGVVGFSMGGAFALATAASVPEVRACVAFYGVPRPDVDLSKMRARVLGHYARVDAHVSPERLEQVEAELRRAGVPVTLHRYDAPHSFFNDALAGEYSAEDAKLAWDRTLLFLKEALA